MVQFVLLHIWAIAVRCCCSVSMKFAHGRKKDGMQKKHENTAWIAAPH